MRRRDIVRTCAAVGAAGSLGLLAGCSGGSTVEKSTLSVENFDYEAGEDGNFVLLVTVKNAGDEQASGDLYVTVVAATPTSTGNATATTAAGEDGTLAHRETRDVTVPGGETKVVRVAFDFGVSQFERNGSLDIDLRD